MTLIQAQEKYIARALSCNTGHSRRVRNAAAKELKEWASRHGYDAEIIHRDAKDMVALLLNSDE
jgi:hypothetical protein